MSLDTAASVLPLLRALFFTVAIDIGVLYWALTTRNSERDDE